MSDAPPSDTPPQHEPMFAAPLAAVVLPIVIIVVVLLELTLTRDGRAALFDAWGLNPLLVRQGRGELLISYAFLHGSVLQAVVNAGLLLIFSTPLVRAFGGGGWAFVSLLMLYLLSSIAAGLAFCLLHLHDNLTVIGASAAAMGIVGAAARLPWQANKTRILSFLNPQVLTLTVLVLGYHGFAALTQGIRPTTMAWESHLAAYALGLVIGSPWLHLFHRRYFTTN